MGGILSVFYTYLFLSSNGSIRGGFFEFTPNTYGYAFVHAIIASLLMIQLIRVGEKTVYRNSESLVFVSLLTICLYNYCSSGKFIISELYPGFIDTPVERLFGSLYVDIVILVAIRLWDKLNSKHISKRVTNPKYYKINIFLTLAVTMLYFVKTLNTIIFHVSFLVISNATLDRFLNSLLCALALFLVIMGYYSKKNKIIYLFLFVIIIGSAVISSIGSGKRNQLLVPVIFVIAILYLMQKINFKFFRALISGIPIGIVFLSNIIFLLSERYSTRNYWYVRDFVYRFDISDFAITIAKSGSVSYGSIVDGIISAIPRLQYAGNGYSNTMLKAGLSGIEDYNDTIFSIGAEVLGYVGILIIPIIILLFLEELDYFLKSRKTYNLRLSRFLIIFEFTVAETTWAMFILYTRNAILGILIGFILLKILLKARCKKLTACNFMEYDFHRIRRTKEMK